MHHPTPALTGFEPPAVELPRERTDVPLHRRRRAALLVLAIGRLATPEEVIDGMLGDVVAAFSDALELDEALQWTTLLLDALMPRTEVAR